MNCLEVTGTLVGLAYLWLEYRTSIYLWIAGIIMPTIRVFVCYRAGLCVGFGINIYYPLAAVYEWIVWVRGAGRESKAELLITYTPPEGYLPLTAVLLAAFPGITWILIRFTDGNVSWLDLFTTALSIVGMWMLVRKYVEQWWARILVDVVCCGLYTYKELYFISTLYEFCSIIAIFGHFKWKQIVHYENK